MKRSPLTDVDLITRLLVRRPWLMFSLGVLLCLVVGAGMGQLRLETDYEIFFAPEAREVQRFREFQADFGREDTLFFAVSAPLEQTLIEERGLQAVGDLSRRARALPYVRRMASIANYPVVDAHEDDINIAPAYHLEDGEIISTRAPWEMEQRLLQEAAVRHKLLSGDGNTAGILAILVLDAEQRAQSAKQAWAAVQQLLEEMRGQYPEYEFRVTGSTALDAAFEEANRQDLSLLFPIAVSAMVLLAALVFRSPIFYLAMSLVVTAATVSCLGFAGWAGIPLSSVSITSPVIVIILSIAALVHLFVAMRRQQGQPGRDERLRTAVRKVFLPSLLTAATTIAGLLTLNFSASPPFRHLGNIAAFGVGMSFVYTFMLGAPLLRLMSAGVDRIGALEKAMGKLAEFVTGPRGWVAALVATGMILALISGIGLNRIDDNYVEYFSPSFEFRRDSDFIDRKLSGIHSLEYSFRADGGEVFSEPYLRALRDFEDWARQQPGVRSVDTVENAIAQVHRAFNNNDERYRQTPNDDDLVQQYSMLYEMSVPADFDFRNRVSGDGATSRATLYLSNLSISEIVALDEQAIHWLRGNSQLAAAEATEPGATGTSILFSHIGLSNIRNMLLGTALLFAMATLLMWLIFRRPVLAASASFANLLPALATLGLWGLLVGQLGMGSAAVVAVTLGILLDDTIHLGHRYLMLRQAGADTEEAVRTTLIEVGPALVVTTLILCIGFLLIALSAFDINASMGMVVASTVVIALVFDLLVMPVVLLRFDAQIRNSQEESIHVQTVA